LDWEVAMLVSLDEWEVVMVGLILSGRTKETSNICNNVKIYIKKKKKLIFFFK